MVVGLGCKVVADCFGTVVVVAVEYHTETVMAGMLGVRSWDGSFVQTKGPVVMAVACELADGVDHLGEGHVADCHSAATGEQDSLEDRGRAEDLAAGGELPGDLCIGLRKDYVDCSRWVVLEEGRSAVEDHCNRSIVGMGPRCGNHHDLLESLLCLLEEGHHLEAVVGVEPVVHSHMGD